MDIELLKNTSSLIIIGATFFNLYVVYKNFKISEKNEKTKTPVIDIKLDNLPPYKGEKEKSILRIKNVGTKATNPNLSTTLSCSWMPSLSMKFNLPSEDYILAPNEKIIWKFRLDENIPPSSLVYVEILDTLIEKRFYGGSKNALQWELTEQL